MRLTTALRTALVGASWLAAVGAAAPVVSALRGDFRIDVPERRLRGRLLPVSADRGQAALALDTTSALVLVYSATCTACQGNTDNWLRLTADLRAQHPDTPIILVRARPDTAAALQIPSALRVALPEYRLDSGTVESVLGAERVPATLVVTGGRVTRMIYGTVGPRRQGRIQHAFPAGAQ